MAKTPEGITITPTVHADVVALLGSEELAAVERGISQGGGLEIIYDDPNSVTTTNRRAEISVSGLTVEQIREYLCTHREALIAFGIASLGDQRESESEDEEQGVTLGLGNGFGILYAIYHHFITQRPKAEFHAFLKNRRIGRQATFAKNLRRIYESLPGSK
jgi:hypothetical protein